MVKGIEDGKNEVVLIAAELFGFIALIFLHKLTTMEMKTDCCFLMGSVNMQ